MTGWEGRISSCPRCIFHAEHGPHVGAGLPAMTSSQPPHIYLTPRNQTVGAGLPAMAAWQSTQLDRVHIHSCGNGHLGFRFYSGSLLKSAKVSKTLLPHHSAPRLGSVCPHSGLNPWAAVMGHPWPRTANPASCRVTHEFKPAFGQRGLTGRLRSRSRSRAARFASWLPSAAIAQKLCRYLCCDSGISVRHQVLIHRYRRQASSHIYCISNHFFVSAFSRPSSFSRFNAPFKLLLNAGLPF